MARFIIDIDSTEEGLTSSEIVQVLEKKYALITCFKIDKENTNQFHNDWLLNDITDKQIKEYRLQLAQNFIEDEGFWGVYEYLCQEGWNISSEATYEDIINIKFTLQKFGYDLDFSMASASIKSGDKTLYNEQNILWNHMVYYILFKLVFIDKFKI